jgi:competence protein ComEA
MSQNVDLNSVSAQDLERVPVVGKEHARKIVEFRQKNGQFKNWEELKRIPGITPDMLDTLKRSGYTVSGKAS